MYVIISDGIEKLIGFLLLHVSRLIVLVECR